jgi:hypothetical protein
MNLIYSDDVSIATDIPDNSGILLSGGNGVPPAIGETPQENKSFGLKDFLGSIGSSVKTLATGARDIGTAVGTVQGAANQAKIDFNTARKDAATPTIKSKVHQWWTFSTTNDKIVAGLGAACLIVAIIQLNKK